MLSTDADGVVLAIRVKPRARSTRILGERDGRLQISVTAPPVDGRANAAVGRLLAKTLGVGITRIQVVGGERSRDKLIRIAGAEARELRERLARANER